jgi:prophage DNA circulation protein
MARDWLNSLWRASFRGASFWVEKDDETGARRIVIHQFPNRDDPFLEDLGEDKREFDVTAYVASDAADREAAALMAACTQRGAGTLVLPTHGPIQVRCHSAKRDRDKDKHGKIAFTLKFLREGASSALVSVLSLANLVFVAVDGLATAASAFFSQAVVVTNQPDFVVAAAVTGVQDGASMLEAIRTDEPIAAAVSSVQRDAIQAIFDAAPTAITRTDGVDVALAPQVFAAARGLGDGMAAETAIRAFEVVIDVAVAAPAAVYGSPSWRTSDANKIEAYRLARLAAIAAYAEGIVRAKIADRPTGITLRANVAEHFDDELEALWAADNDLFLALQAARGAVIEYLSRVILDLAPVVTVEANLSMPSLFWAYRLYEDPTRSTELVARNPAVQHPSFMPDTFEALAR